MTNDFFVLLGQSKPVYTIIKTEDQLKLFMFYFKKYTHQDECFYRDYFKVAKFLIHEYGKVGACSYCAILVEGYGSSYKYYDITEVLSSINMHASFLTFKQRVQK